LQGEDLTTFLSNLFTNSLSSKFLSEFPKSRLLSFINHDLHHFFTDQLLLRVLGIACSSDLLASSLCETNAENSKKISIEGLGLHKRFNKSVPFLNKGAQFVFGNVHTVEVGVAIVTLDFLNLDFEF